MGFQRGQPITSVARTERKILRILRMLGTLSLSLSLSLTLSLSFLARPCAKDASDARDASGTETLPDCGGEERALAAAAAAAAAPDWSEAGQKKKERTNQQRRPHGPTHARTDARLRPQRPASLPKWPPEGGGGAWRWVGRWVVWANQEPPRPMRPREQLRRSK